MKTNERQKDKTIGNKISKENLSILISRFRHPKLEERFKASEEVVKIGYEAAPELMKLLVDNNWEVRWRAAYVFGKIGLITDKDINSIGKLVEDPNQNVRVWALKALKLNKRKSILKYLIKATEDSDSEVRKEAIEGLSFFEDKTAIKKIIKFLSDEECDVKVSSAWALGVNGNRESYEILRYKLMCEKDKQVVMIIRNSLSKLRIKLNLPEEIVGCA